MAASARFLTNFMLLSSLALLNVFVYIYFTHPALFNLGSAHSHRTSTGHNVHNFDLTREIADGISRVKYDDFEPVANQDTQPHVDHQQAANQDVQPPVNNQQVANQDVNPPVNNNTAGIDLKKRPILSHNFKLIINHPDKCMNTNGTAADVFLLVLINSIHRNFDQRKAIRDTWGSPTMVHGKRVITMFLLAKVHDDKLQELVLQENEKFGDLLMENFDDTYMNLTLKSVMGFKWANNYCSHARYGMKTDDDMFVNYANLVQMLKGAPTKNFAAGYLINGAPIRNVKSKWYMSKDIYPKNKYPPFLSGTGYAMSMDVICNSYKTALKTPFLYLEDVFIALCWEQIGVRPIKNNEFFNSKARYSLCRYRKVITSHYMTPSEMYRIWRDMASRKHILCPGDP